MEEKDTRAGGKRMAAGGGTGKKAAIALGAAAVLVLAGYLGLCAYAGSGGGRMAPNTHIGGVAVGGQSTEAAAATLESALEERLAALGVQFSCEGKLYTVPGGEFSYDAAGAVTVASPASGSFFTRGAKFLQGLLSKNGHAVALTLDHVPEAVVRAARECGDADTQTTWEVTDTAVVFTKGRTGRSLDAAQLMAALTERAGHLLNNDEPAGYAPVEAVVAVAPPGEPDFEMIRRGLFTEAAEAYLDRESGEIVPSVTGKDLDIDAARTALAGAEEGKLCRVELTLDVPAVTTESLTESLFRDTLGSAATRVTGTADRKMNVRVAAAFLDGKIVFPGEEFSFNQACSPYSVANGYGKATAYVNGLSKDTVAGGICQASSTLYWASLKANLETVERSAHRYEPSYVNGGLDATVYGDYQEEGSLDFRFKNSTEHPIKLEAYMDDRNYLYVNIYGTDTTGVHGEPYSTNRVVIQAYETIYEPSDAIPQGTTQKDPERTGYHAVSWDTYQKLVDAEGNTVSETKLYTTKYKLRNAVVLYNPADMALWGIDPYTGLQTLEPVVPSTEPGGEAVLPPEGSQPGETPPAETGTLPPPGETGTVQPPAESFPILPVPTPIPDPGEAILPPGA